MEVVEVGSPAVHDTFGDLDMSLPTGSLRPDRDFGGQRFVRHVASDARWMPWQMPGFEHRDTGFDRASGGVAGAGIVRTAGASGTPAVRHDGELLLMFVHDGEMTFSTEQVGSVELAQGDSVVVPAATTFWLDGCSPDLELLEVTSPGRPALAAAAPPPASRP